MLADVAPFVLLGVVFFGLEYAYDRWNSRAPTPDGLFNGETLIGGLRAWLRVDDARRVGYGFAYLTDMRIVWTPNLGSWPLWNVLRTAPYNQPVIVELSQVRRVDARFRLGGSRLIVEAPDLRLELGVDGGSFGGWERYIKANGRNLLPDDQPVLRSGNRYSRQEVLAGSRGAAIFTAVLMLYVAAEGLNAVTDLGGKSLSDVQLGGLIVAVLALGLAYLAWETRPR